MKIALVMISLAVIAIAIMTIRSRTKETEIKSFWDLLRNPTKMTNLGQFHKDVDASASAFSGSAPKIASLIDDYVFQAKPSRDAWTEKRIIAELGEEAYPRALEILRDPINHERLVVLTKKENSLPESPIFRLCEIFDSDTPPPQEAALLLAPYLKLESDEIRKSAALIIGSVGSAQSLPDLQRALRDENEYVKSYALMGIQRAISGNRIIPSSKNQFFELVADMWPQDTNFNCAEKIPKILLSLDRELAIERLLSPDLFTAQFDPIWRILEAFEEEKVDVPRPRLLALIDEAHKEPLKYPMDNALEGALSLLGRHRTKEDLSKLETLVDHLNEDVSNGAIKGLYNYHEYEDRIRDPRQIEETSGWESLTTAEKHLLAIEDLDAEVNNGGFAQYYFNSSGNRWQSALDGLAAIGAIRRHAIVIDTIEKFERSAPSPDRKERDAQLSKIVRQQEDPFNEQDTAWYAAKDEPLNRLLFRYNFAHLDGRKKSN